MDDKRTFLVRVTAMGETDPDAEEDYDWFNPEDFVDFLRERFQVPEDAKYGLDAYNKNAPQLLVGFELVEPFEPESALHFITCHWCSRVIHLDAQGDWRDSTNLKRCDEEDGNHAP